MATSNLNRIVLDANIMVSAILGRGFPILAQLVEAGAMLMTPSQQVAETRNVLRRRKGLPPEWIDAQMLKLLELVTPLNPALFDVHEAEARSRLHARGQPDWPVLAASIATGASIWSHDKDFFGSGGAVWSTRILNRQLEQQDA